MNPDPKSTAPTKAGTTQTYTMNPNNVGPCSVGATATGDFEVIQVGGDGSVTVRAKNDNGSGTLSITKRCPFSTTEGAPAECGPTTQDYRLGTGGGGVGWEVLKTIGLVVTLPLFIVGFIALIICWIICFLVRLIPGAKCDCDETKKWVEKVYDGFPDWLKKLLK